MLEGISGLAYSEMPSNHYPKNMDKDYQGFC